MAHTGAAVFTVAASKYPRKPTKRADVNSFGHSTDAESDAPAQWIMELTRHVSAKVY